MQRLCLRHRLRHSSGQHLKARPMIILCSEGRTYFGIMHWLTKSIHESHAEAIQGRVCIGSHGSTIEELRAKSRLLRLRQYGFHQIYSSSTTWLASTQLFL